jgi:hypothetical protein
MSRSTISTFQLFERFPDQEAARIKDLSAKRRAASLARETFAGGRNGGRPRSKKPRCPCGKMTARRANARRHVCAVE